MLVAWKASPRQARKQRSVSQEIFLPPLWAEHDVSRKGVMTKPRLTFDGVMWMCKGGRGKTRWAFARGFTAQEAYRLWTYIAW